MESRPPTRRLPILLPLTCTGVINTKPSRFSNSFHPQAVICRMPLMYGLPGPRPVRALCRGSSKKLEAQQPLPLFVDEYRSPAYVEDAAEGLLMALEKGVGMPSIWAVQNGSVAISLVSYWQKSLTLMVPQFPPLIGPRCPCQPHALADLTTHNHRAIAMGYAPRTPREGLDGDETDE